MTNTKYKITEQDVSDLACLYYGYYAASKDHRLAMEFIEAMGWDWKDLIKIRRLASRLMKLDGVK